MTVRHLIREPLTEPEIRALAPKVGSLENLVAPKRRKEAAGLTGDKLVNALFQSVTCRTAGFNSVGFDALQPATLMLFMVLMFVGAGIPDEVQNPLVYGMGCVLLAVGVRQSYAKGTAEAELIKQYEFMGRIFHNARRRLDDAVDDVARRGILKSLGDAALEEHAQWILMHRERSVGQEDIVRLG